MIHKEGKKSLEEKGKKINEWLRLVLNGSIRERA
jgi:hypothetical protein